MIRTQPPPLPSKAAQARQERIDLFLLLGQGVGCLVLGSWAGQGAAPAQPGAAWFGAGILMLALMCGYASARVLVATVLAPLAVMQLINRMRDPKAGRTAVPMQMTAQERRMQIGLNLLIVGVFIAVALLGAVALWIFAHQVSLLSALWRFGLPAVLLALPVPRAVRALG